MVYPVAEIMGDLFQDVCSYRFNLSYFHSSYLYTECDQENSASLAGRSCEIRWHQWMRSRDTGVSWSLTK